MVESTDGVNMKNPKPGSTSSGLYGVTNPTALDADYLLPLGITPARNTSDEEKDRVGAELITALYKIHNDIDYASVAYHNGKGYADRWWAAGAKIKDLDAKALNHLTKFREQLGITKPGQKTAIQKLMTASVAATPKKPMAVLPSTVDYEIQMSLNAVNATASRIRALQAAGLGAEAFELSLKQHQAKALTYSLYAFKATEALKDGDGRYIGQLWTAGDPGNTWQLEYRSDDTYDIYKNGQLVAEKMSKADLVDRVQRQSDAAHAKMIAAAQSAALTKKRDSERELFTKLAEESLKGKYALSQEEIKSAKFYKGIDAGTGWWQAGGRLFRVESNAESVIGSGIFGPKITEMTGRPQ